MTYSRILLVLGSCAAPALAQTIDPYDGSVVHQLVIEFDPAEDPDWDQQLAINWMCWQGWQYNAWCSPCTEPQDPVYVPASITFDGVEVTGGVRYRGSSTFLAGMQAAGVSLGQFCEADCATPHPFTGGGCKIPLALSLDDRIGGCERLDLNNLAVDASHIKDVLARRMTGAVMPGHRFSYVRVWIGPSTEGELIDLGLYLNLEHLDSEFVERRTLAEDPYRYKGGTYLSSPCNDPDAQAEGGDPDAPCEEQFATVIDLVDFLATADPLAVGFEQDLDTLVDVDNFLWHYALWVVLGDSDGFQRETYQDNHHSHLNADGYSSGRLQWLASDVDRSFSLSEQPIEGTGSPCPGALSPAVLANDALRLRFEHHVRHLLATDFTVDNMNCWGTGTGELILPELGGASEIGYAPDVFPDNELWNAEQFALRLDALLGYVSDRRDFLFGHDAFSRPEAAITKVMHSPNPVTESPVNVKVAVASKSLVSVTLYWRTVGGFEAISMSPASPTVWCATIPEQPAHTTVEYYVEAVQATATGDAASYSPATAAQHAYSYVVAESWSDGEVLLNEVSAKGGDWIELYNPTNGTVDLTGFWLNRGEGAGIGFQFVSSLDPADRMIPAGGHLLIYCDEDVTTPLNTDFGLDKDGDTVALYDDGGACVDFYRFGREFSLLSRGRAFDGEFEWVEHVQPSPGASNGVFGDFNGDLVVDGDDLAIFLQAYGTTCCLGCPEDLNGDEIVNTQDLLILLSLM